MSWTFAMIFASLCALAMGSSNDLGPGAYVLPAVSGVFALLAVLQQRQLPWRQRVPATSPGEGRWTRRNRAGGKRRRG